MKILLATTYIYDKRWIEFTKNKTGFGMMVNDIFQSIAEKEDIFLLSHVITGGRGERILKHTIGDVILTSTPKDWVQGGAWFLKYKQSFKGRVRYFYYCLNKGYVRNTIKRIKPDVIHIHGLNQATKTYMEVCDELNVPYIVTLHGLIGLNDTVSAASWDKEFEREFLLKSENESIPVTVISTGMKNRIEENYLHHKAENIVVITNGTDIPHESVCTDGEWNLRRKYNLPSASKIGLVVGSICERKNQVQIIDAMAELPTDIREKCAIFFCGRDYMNGQIQKKIERYQLQNNIFVLGFLSRNILSQLLDQADFNLVASKDEGFGLSIIEAFSHGLPTVTFNDIDAVMDLFNERAMVLAHDRSTKSLALAIHRVLEQSWDAAYIKEFAVRFSLWDMADKYVKEYGSMINPNGYK